MLLRRPLLNSIDGSTWSISSGAQYVALDKYFSHPSLVIYFFATPPIILKLGQQISTNSNPPGPIIMIDQSETLISSEIVFIALFSAGAQRCCVFYQAPPSVQLC